MGSNFSKIKIGAYFITSDGEQFRKTSELTYDDGAGIERYIDPFFDKKIGAAPTEPKPDVDTSARVVKGDETAPKKVAKKSAKKSTKKTKK